MHAFDQVLFNFLKKIRKQIFFSEEWLNKSDINIVFSTMQLLRKK